MIGPAGEAYYVYRLVDPRTDKTFYIGKGKGKRLEQHEKDARAGRSGKKCDLIREILADDRKVSASVVSWFAEELAAFEYEIKLIAEIGLASLTNVLPGGQGAPSLNLTKDEIKDRYRRWRLRPRVLEAAARFRVPGVFPFEVNGRSMGIVYSDGLSAIATDRELPVYVFEGEASALDVLLSLMCDPACPVGTRYEAAVTLADYCLPFGRELAVPRAAA